MEIGNQKSKIIKKNEKTFFFLSEIKFFVQSRIRNFVFKKKQQTLQGTRPVVQPDIKRKNNKFIAPQAHISKRGIIPQRQGAYYNDTKVHYSIKTLIKQRKKSNERKNENTKTQTIFFIVTITHPSHSLIKKIPHYTNFYHRTKSTRHQTSRTKDLSFLLHTHQSKIFL